MPPRTLPLKIILPRMWKDLVLFEHARLLVQAVSIGSSAIADMG